MNADVISGVALVVAIMSLSLGIFNVYSNYIYTRLVKETARRLGELDESE